MENPYLLIFLFVLAFYAVGFSILNAFFRPVLEKAGFFGGIALSWIAGNAAALVILYILAAVNRLDLVNRATFFYTLAAVAAAFIFSVIYRVKKLSWRDMPWNLGILALFLLFFFPLIKSSLFTYLYGWDSMAIVFLKAKAFFFAPGFWNNPFFHSEAYTYAVYAYPLGLSLLLSSFYRIAGMVNDQAVLFYLLQFYLVTLFLFCGVFAKFFPRLNRLFAPLAAVTFLIIPTAMRFLFKGYIDMAIGCLFSAGLVLFIMFLEEANLKTKLNFWLLLFITTVTASALKGEGLVLLISMNTLAAVVFLLQFIKTPRPGRHLSAPEWIFSAGTALAFLLPLLIWEYFKRKSQLIFYYDNLTFNFEALKRAKTIIFAYLDELQNTSRYGLLLIPSTLATLLFSTYLALRRNFRALLPPLTIVLQLAAYTLIYLATPLPLNLQLNSSLERLVLQLLPALFIAFLYVLQKSAADGFFGVGDKK